MAYTPYQQREFNVLYSLTDAPKATSRYVEHNILSKYEFDGELTEDRVFSIFVPAEELETVLVMSNGGAKANAYKQLLRVNTNTKPAVLSGRSEGPIQRRANAMARAAHAAEGALEYLQGFNAEFPESPIDFSL